LKVKGKEGKKDTHQDFQQKAATNGGVKHHPERPKKEPGD